MREELGVLMSTPSVKQLARLLTQSTSQHFPLRGTQGRLLDRAPQACMSPALEERDILFCRNDRGTLCLQWPRTGSAGVGLTWSVLAENSLL